MTDMPACGFGRVSLHTWTLDKTSLPQVLDIARITGYDGVEVRWLDLQRLREAGYRYAALRDFLRNGGIPICVMGVRYGCLFCDESNRSELFDAFEETCQLALEVDCSMLMTAPGPGGTDLKHASENLAECGRLAHKYGLKLAVEFSSQSPVVNNLDRLQALLHMTDHPSCGMLLDSYHMHRSGDLHRLKTVDASRLFAFQYSDAPPNPELGVRYPVDRLLPGDGVLDFDEVFKTLRTLGYSGYLSLEAPNPRIWAEDPVEVAVKGLTQSKRFLAPSSPAKSMVSA